jgi:2,3-dihydroxyphenylpropionate 1,2-dioxygenase
MSVAIVCASHTPLMYRGPASNETEQRVRTAFSQLGTFVKEFAPDYVIQFAPDHFNGFFYDLMPPFCIGAGAVSLGDWGGGTGPLDVPEKTALELIDHVRSESFDVAVSYRMPVDHGFVQMWEAVLGDFRSVPILPIFVNAAAPPVPTYRRARQLGESVGRFAMRSGRKVLFAASGGLSHDPPLPAIADAPPEIRERLINGRNPSPEAKEASEKRVLEAGVLAEAGKGPSAQSGMGSGVHGYPAKRRNIARGCARYRQGARRGGPRRQRGPRVGRGFRRVLDRRPIHHGAGILRSHPRLDRRHGDGRCETERRRSLIVSSLANSEASRSNP